MDNRSDILLIEDYLIDNDNKSLGILWERHQDYLYNAILAKVNFNEAIARDILQDGFIRIKNAIDKGGYKEKGNIKAWMVTIVKNMTIDHHRKKKRVPSTPMTIDSLSPDDDGDISFIWNIIGVNSSIEDEIINAESDSYSMDKLKFLIESLSPEQRRIVNYRFFQKMSFKAIAEKEEVSINTCLGRMRYALINMNKIIEEKGFFKKNDSSPIDIQLSNFAEEVATGKHMDDTKTIDMGTETKRTRRRRTLVYSEAKKVMKSLGLKSKKDFDAYKETNTLPVGIPSHPYQTYKVGDGTWQGWKDFLGVEATGASSLHSEESSGHDTPEKSDEGKENTSSAARNTFTELSMGSAKAILKKKIEEAESIILVERAKLIGYKTELKALG